MHFTLRIKKVRQGTKADRIQRVKHPLLTSLQSYLLLHFQFR